MLARIEEFCALLRKNQVRVPTASVIDAVRAAAAVGLENPADLHAALAATLVKRPGDRRAFDELFQLFFWRGGRLARELAGIPLSQMLAQLGLAEDQIEAILAFLAAQAAQLGAVAMAALGLRGGGADVLSLVRMSGMDGTRIVSPLHVGYHAQRLYEALDLRGVERQLGEVQAALAAALGPEAARALREVVAQNLTALRQALRRHVQDEFEKQNRDLLEDFRLRTLAERPFSSLGEEDLAKLRAEIVRLARKLRTQASLRPRVRARGRLDVRRTLRRSLATGGVPFALRRRHRRVERPRLVILCDISDSVRHVSRFMLELVYTIQELFDRVRSYVFVAELGEVTRLFAGYEIDRAVALAYGGAVIPVHQNSNYGRAFDAFVDRHLDAVTSRTTVIVIGDARNNYNPPRVERLAEIRRRAKRLLWLNPELPGAWGFGDSAMRDYEPCCDRVVVAYNLESLRRVIDDLVL